MGNQTEKTLAQQQLAQLVYQAQTHTAEIARLMSQVVNDVLLCELIVIPPEGFVMREFQTPFGSIALKNHAASVMLVQAAGPTGVVAPTNGVGLGQCDANSAMTYALTGRTLTIYGTPAATATLQVFTICVPPAFSR